MIADSNDFVTAPAQQKLEWVTPKISLLIAVHTDGKPYHEKEMPFFTGTPTVTRTMGPS